jgi:hypothetical protein
LYEYLPGSISVTESFQVMGSSSPVCGPHTAVSPSIDVGRKPVIVLTRPSTKPTPAFTVTVTPRVSW